ncbi:glycosyl hydrolase [Streptomyces sp. NPDC020845]|uniref:glycosyl hydrolase n=1 Tax=Streptomyces sp. NPDC020845 TaxID=3365096 RepID=UPI0037A06093
MSSLSRRQFCAGTTAVALAPSVVSTAGTAVAAPSDAGLGASFAKRFAAPPAAAKPKIRYWWPCGEIAAATLDAELKTIADRGFGGVELQCMMTLEPQKYGWGSDTQTARLEQAVAAGRKYGVHVDLTVGPAWPLLAPGLTPDSGQAAQELVYGRTVVAGGETYTGPVPAGPAPHSGVTAQTLIAVQAWRCSGDPAAKPTVLEQGSLVELTGEVRDGKITWTAPKGDQWVLLGYWQRGTGQAAVTGQYVAVEPAYVVDHFATAGARAAIDYTETHVFTPRLRRLLRSNGGNLFEDSLELDSALHWTWDLLKRFEKLRGYALRDRLPVVFIDKIHRQYTSVTPDDTPDFEFSDGGGARVRDDYFRTLTDLYISEHVEPLKHWAHGLGLTFRAQPYGTTLDTPTVAATLDVNETESLGTAPDYNDETWHWVSSGAVHLAGHEVFSLEGCATLNEAYAQTWPQMLKHFNTAFAHGVNQVVYHGFATAHGLGEKSWPGFSPFTFGQGGNGFSESWGPRQTTWADTDKITGWTTRMQWLLRQGRPQVDLVVYRHSYVNEARVPAGLTGFTFDFAGSHQLDGTRVKARRLAPEGPAYRALIIDRQPTLPVDTARRLLAHARAGLPIVVVGEPPRRTPGAHHAKQQDAELATIIRQLLKQPSVRRVTEQSGAAEALSELGVRPAADTGAAPGLLATCRTLDRGALYHLHNPTSNTVTGEVILDGAGRPHRLEAWTGEITPLGRYRTEKGRTAVPVLLVPGGSTVIALPGSGRARHAVAVSGGDVTVTRSGRLGLRATEAGTCTVTLDDGTKERVTVPEVPAARQLTKWSLSVEAWHRGTDGARAVTTHQVELDGLKPWSDIPELQDASGVGTYRTTVRLSRLDGAHLDLGRVTDTFEVSVNGKVLPPVDQISRRADLAGHLREGDNTITVRVATPLRNALRVTDGFPAQAHKPRQEYGLIGPVRLTPYAEVPVRG